MRSVAACSAFTKAYIEKTGGKVVGEEYLPMDGSDWTPIISKLKSARARRAHHLDGRRRAECDVDQAVARAPASTLPYGNLAVDEGTAKSMGADADGIYISASYVTGIDTPANKTFLQRMTKKFGAELKTPNDLSVPEYEAVYAYKAAVEKAGGTDAPGVLKALPTVCVDGPRGTIRCTSNTMPPLTMYLGQVQADGGSR